MTLTAMPARDAELLQRLEQYTAAFRADFRRPEQARWAAAYLLGLLCCPERRTVENLARTLAPPPEWGVKDVAQALQHFVNQSPWDEDRVGQRHQLLVAERLPAGGLLVVNEMTFVKQGRRSVGVQRQYSSSLGRKANCQLAVSLHHVGPGFTPLLLKLYLPRAWLQDADRLDEAGVPPGERARVGKTQLALGLLDRALSAGVPAKGVALGPSRGIGEDFAEEVARRGLAFVADPPRESLAAADQGCRALQEELGLDHFEGRSWRGFHHHACLVLLAHAFRATMPDVRG